MERLRYRATTLTHMLAEIHQAELLAEAERRRQPRPTARRRSFLGLPLPRVRRPRH
ncbi:MAG TPA: hypothetical protein VF365_07100 [Candidatus Limnocylindria bacterium]